MYLDVQTLKNLNGIDITVKCKFSAYEVLHRLLSHNVCGQFKQKGLIELHTQLSTNL